MDPGALTGLVLAGGQGQRMGGVGKGLVEFAGAPLVSWAIRCLRPHVGEVLVSANRHLEQYAAVADRVVEDIEAGFHGPLMGIYSGLRAARSEWVVIVPCDSPLLPDDLVARLARVVETGADIAIADDGERRHPVVAMMRQALHRDLGLALASGERKVGRWYARHECRPVDVSDCAEAFTNLNSEAERSALESHLRRQHDEFH
ncbi:molybdenum cofactor guanylyltransferase MobA [Halomonas cupida]|uniref:molybdenum cofactor guanylyltransferase MobA n=1 Tax=Halomonas cupida TaxID=44933 RepID=UPI003A9292C1